MFEVEWQNVVLANVPKLDSPKQENKRLNEGLEVVVAIDFRVRVELDIAEHLREGSVMHLETHQHRTYENIQDGYNFRT